MNVPSFDLVDQPWLPCVTLEGVGVEVSLRQALLQAHAFRELYDPSPLVTVSLHRLLLAVLHRAYDGPRDVDGWRRMWQAGEFDPAEINPYLDCWRHRFDLFDAERPFYQVPFLAELADPKKQAPVAKLAQEAAAGNNVTLFDHSIDAEPVPSSAAAAARLAVAVQAFSIGFGKSTPFYLSDSTLIRGYSVLASGGTLFATLMANLLRYSGDAPIPRSRQGDAPIWEQDNLPIPDKEGTPPAGYCDLLTWQSRQLHLIPDADGATVSRCQLRQNMKLGDNVLDPFKCFRRDEQKGWRPRSFRPQRALWRDSTALFEQFDASSERATRRPALVDWLAQIGDEYSGEADPSEVDIRLSIFGLTADDGNAASVVLWRREELPLPLGILNHSEAVLAIRDAVYAAEEVGRLLNKGAHHLAEHLLAPEHDAPGGRKPDREKAVVPLVRSLGIEARYWPRLEAPFSRFLHDLPGDSQPDPEDETIVSCGAATLPIWAATLRTTALAAFRETTDGLDGSARTLKAVARAERMVRGSLNKALLGLAEREDERRKDVA